MTDVIVIGAGVAGWVAARRAQQLGLDVTILERGDRPTGQGNTTLSGGQFHASYRNPLLPPDVLADRLAALTEGHARPDVIRAWADNVGRAFRFLESQGGDFGPLDTAPDGYERFTLQPDVIGQSPRQPHERRVGSGPWRLLTTMSSAFVRGGGTLRLSARATELITDRSGAVCGVELLSDDGSHERMTGAAVVVADGGFQANPKLVSEYITSYYKLSGGDADQGDGLVMGMNAGAAIINMRPFYGHPLVRDAVTNQRIWPTPSPDPLCKVGMVIDGSGRRFVDEGLGDRAVADAIAGNATPERCWVIFDAQAWETAGRTGLQHPNPVLINEGATVVRAASVEDLARAIEVDGAALRGAIDDFNAYAESAHPIHPVRTQEAVPLRVLPLMAIPLVAGITFTMGGLLVNGQAQVLNEDETPIGGLFAAGGSMGGLQGGPNAGYAGGWSEAATFGLLAAEAIHRQRSAARRA